MTVSLVDLHIHSTASDGRLTPAEVVRKAVSLGLKYIAITDHDSVGGIVPALEAAAKFPGFRVIPGVEINTDVSQGEAHILGYFMDYTHPELLATWDRMRNSREIRAQKMIEKLRSIGLPIEWQRVREIAGIGAVGRPHIAQALFEKGYIASIREAFQKYIAWGGPAYVEREKVAPIEAARIILRASGLPVLAHHTTFPDCDIMIAELKKNGLIGIEAYYAGYKAEETARLVAIAEGYGLIATGGSDYHGFEDGIETPIGGVNVPVESAERLIALVENRAMRLAGS